MSMTSLFHYVFVLLLNGAVCSLHVRQVVDVRFDCCYSTFTNMRAFWMSWTTGGSLDKCQLALVSRFRMVALHHPNHQPLPQSAAQLHVQRSLSLSGVLNIFPFGFQSVINSVIASPASPLYPATVIRYLPASSLMKNVEYSAEYHIPLSRWIWPHPFSTRYYPFLMELVDNKRYTFSRYIGNALVTLTCTQ